MMFDVMSDLRCDLPGLDPLHLTKEAEQLSSCSFRHQQLHQDE